MQNPRRYEAINTHYQNLDNLETRVLELLDKANVDTSTISPENLAALDQFHAGGLAATIELSELLSISPKTKILDVGSGLGGPSRYLAYRFGCSICGVELLEGYCQTARTITRLMKLEDQVSYVTADALHLPFANHTFDIVWTQHVVMNIEDREALYKEFARVLKPNGYLAFYDVVAKHGGALYFPVPWAVNSELSHLLTQEQTHSLLADLGFEACIWEDVTEHLISWLAARERSQAEGPKSPLSLEMVMGDQFPVMLKNYRRNLEEERCGVLQAVLQKCTISGGCR